MPYKDIDKQDECLRKWYLQNKQHHLQNVKAYYTKNKQQILRQRKVEYARFKASFK